MTAVVAKKVGSNILMAIDKKIIGTQHQHKLILHSSFHVQRVLVVATKVEQGTIRGRQQKNPRDNQCFNSKDSHSKINKFLSPVISVSPPLNNSFIIPRPKGIGSRHNSVTGKNQGRQQTTPCYNCCFNRKDVNSNINDF